MRVSRPSATRGAPRVIRGVGLAVCCAALGVAGHAVAGGRLPAPGTTVVLTVLLAAAGIALADRQRGLPAIASTVGGTQVGLHLLLNALAHGHVAGADPPALPIDPVAMTGVHAVATIITALLLAGAERSMFALAGVLGWLLRGVPVRPFVIPVCGPPVVVPAVPAVHVAAGELRLLLRRVHGRRGPPVLL